MISKIKEYFKNRRRKIYEKSISNVFLKDLILKSNKEEVINIVMEDANLNAELFKLYSDSEYSGMADRYVLENIYDDLLKGAKNQLYSNKKTEKCFITEASGGTWSIRYGYIPTYDVFLDVQKIERRLSIISEFVMDEVTERYETYPLEFFVNCRLDKNLLNKSIKDNVADALRQAIFF